MDLLIHDPKDLHIYTRTIHLMKISFGRYFLLYYSRYRLVKFTDFKLDIYQMLAIRVWGQYGGRSLMEYTYIRIYIYIKKYMR